MRVKFRARAHSLPPVCPYPPLIPARDTVRSLVLTIARAYNRSCLRVRSLVRAYDCSCLRSLVLTIARAYGRSCLRSLVLTVDRSCVRSFIRSMIARSFFNLSIPLFNTTVRYHVGLCKYFQWRVLCSCTNSVYNEMHFIAEYTLALKTRPKPALSWAHAPYMVKYDVMLSNCHDSSHEKWNRRWELSWDFLLSRLSQLLKVVRAVTMKLSQIFSRPQTHYVRTLMAVMRL